MKKNLFASVVLISIVLFFSCQQSQNPVSPIDGTSEISGLSKTNESDIIPGQYIVVLKDDISRVPEVANEMAKLHAATVDRVYEHAIKGFATRMSANAAEKLAKNPNVKFIESDRVISLIKPIEVKAKPAPTPTPETTPWGITRVGGGETYKGTSKVWIIDTGVDLANPDLNVNTTLSKTFVTRTKTANDDNGHGTHVAGTIAAIDNDIYVVGVAAGAPVVAVKVLDKRGSGTITGVIAGVDYVAEYAVSGDVANMSLGGGVSQALDDAVFAASRNCKFSLAAGNESDDANNHSPARVNGTNIYTVSAFGSGDVWASFSNYGNPPVDYSAPGVSILSLKKGGGTITYSGTSMAAPHVAGLLLLGNISTNGYVSGDPDGNPDPIAHR